MHKEPSRSQLPMRSRARAWRIIEAAIWLPGDPFVWAMRNAVTARPLNADWQLMTTIDLIHSSLVEAHWDSFYRHTSDRLIMFPKRLTLRSDGPVNQSGW